MASKLIESQHTSKFRWRWNALPGRPNLYLGILLIGTAFGAAHPLASHAILQTNPIATGAQDEEVRRLTPGTLVERELRVIQPHLYAITLESGQFVHIEVEQKTV